MSRQKHFKIPAFNSPSMKIYNTHKLNDLQAWKNIFLANHTHTHTHTHRQTERERERETDRGVGEAEEICRQSCKVKKKKFANKY